MQNGVGYTMNRSIGGTTLTILDMASASKVKLWNINFDDNISLSALEISADVLEHLEDIVADILPDTEEYQSNIQAYLNQVIGTHKSGKAGTADGLSEKIKELFEPYREQIEDAIREYLESIDPAFVVRSNIQSYFSSHDQSPHSGDMIWNAKYGLCYAIFKEVKNSDDTSFPEENGLYSILFTVSDVRYFALYLGPVENPEKFLETLTGFVGKTIGDVVGNLTEGNASAYLNATAAALKALWDDIPEPIPGPMGPQGPKGEDGKDGQDGEDGKDGINGTDGKDGEDGEDGLNGDYYYPCTDQEDENYGKWIKVNGETSEETVTDMLWLPAGTLTAVWDTENGYLTIHNIVDSEGNVTSYSIKTEVPLASLAFVPEVMQDGLGVIDFYSLYTPNDEPAKREYLATNQPIVTYRLNPNNADTRNWDWSFINRSVVMRAIDGDENTLVSIIGEPTIPGDGSIEFQITADDDVLKAVAEEGKEALTALVATSTIESENQREIVSDYSLVKSTDLYEYGIANEETVKIEKDGSFTWVEGTSDLFTECPSNATVNNFDFPAPQEDLTEGDKEVNLIYGESIDLKDYVELWETNVNDAVVDLGFVPEYSFRILKDYIAPDKTNQGDFISLTEDGIVTTTALQGAVGRKPIVIVTASYNGSKSVQLNTLQSLQARLYTNSTVLHSHNKFSMNLT